MIRKIAALAVLLLLFAAVAPASGGLAGRKKLRSRAAVSTLTGGTWRVTAVSHTPAGHKAEYGFSSWLPELREAPGRPEDPEPRRLGHFSHPLSMCARLLPGLRSAMLLRESQSVVPAPLPPEPERLDVFSADSTILRPPAVSMLLLRSPPF